MSLRPPLLLLLSLSSHPNQFLFAAAADGDVAALVVVSPPLPAAVVVVEAEVGGTGSGGAGGAPVPNVEELAAAADGEEDYRNPFAGTEPQSRRPPSKKSHYCFCFFFFFSFVSLFVLTHALLLFFFIADCFSFHLPSSLSNISNQITDRLALVPLYFSYCSDSPHC